MTSTHFASPAPRFDGTDSYVATDDLKLAVNAALALERPLLIKGEPGTGKTMLAEEVSRSLGRPLRQWHIKSTTKAHQGLYEYDAVRSEEHTSELQSLMRISYAVFCLKKKKKEQKNQMNTLVLLYNQNTKPHVT